MNILDVNEICIALNRAHSTVRNMLRKNKFKTAFQKDSLNKWYVKTEDVIKYIKKSNGTEITKKEIAEKINKVFSMEFEEKTEFITVKEAKKELNLCKNSIYRRIKTGKLKAKKVRNGKRVPLNSHSGKYLISRKSILKMKEDNF
jgi:IS30 family transposase